jgi:HTH-type transcriptional regulator / antitoxin HigA
MSTAKTAQQNKSPAKLIQEFPLRPIRNDRELGRAMKIAGHLAVYREGTLRRAEQDYLDTLTVLIEDYERKHCAELPEVTPLEMLKHLVEEHEMNISDLGRVIGSQSNASLILSGKRGISRRVMRLLSEHFGVEPSVFV